MMKSVWVAFLLFPLFAESPVEMIQEIDGQVRTIFSSPDIENNRRKLNQYLEQEMVHQIAVSDFIKLVLGDYWHKANTEQKRMFRQEFINLVIRDYSSVMQTWADPNIKSDFRMYPLEPDQVNAKVFGKISSENADDFLIVFEFVKKDDSWCFLDLSVAGVNFSQLYREEFAGVLSEKGLDGLSDMLGEMNV